MQWFYHTLWPYYLFDMFVIFIWYYCGFIWWPYFTLFNKYCHYRNFSQHIFMTFFCFCRIITSFCVLFLFLEHSYRKPVESNEVHLLKYTVCVLVLYLDVFQGILYLYSTACQKQILYFIVIYWGNA